MKKMHSLSFKVPVIISSIIFVTIATLAIISIFSSSRGIRKATLEGFTATVSGYSSIAFLLIDEFEKSGSFSSGACTFCDSSRNPIQLQSIGIKLKEYSGASYNPTTVSSGKFSIDYNTHSWGGVFPRPSVSLSSPTSITITVYPSSILKLAIPLSEDGSDLLPFQVYRTSNGTLKINA